jgi:hypothetical protein
MNRMMGQVKMTTKVSGREWRANKAESISKRLSCVPADNLGRVEYLIVRGDTLWEISIALQRSYAKKYTGISTAEIVKEIARANKIEDPDLIFAGNKLVLDTVRAETVILEEPAQLTGSPVHPPAKEGLDKDNPVDPEPIVVKSEPLPVQELPSPVIQDLKEEYQASPLVPHIREFGKWLTNILGSAGVKFQDVEQPLNTEDLEGAEWDLKDLSKHPRFIPEKRYDTEFFVPYVKKAKEWLSKMVGM